MRRESEFKEFLIKFKKRHKHSPTDAERYVKFCHRIEGYMGGRDMDELVVSQEEVEATEKVLETKGSFTDTRAALHTYQEFASTTVTGWRAMSPKHRTTGTFRVYDNVDNLVTYENSVRTTDDKKVSGLCDFLEREYDKIRDFARKMFINIWQDFPAIPVYLSKERPEKTYFYDRERILKSIRKICSECDRENCHPPRCPAFNRMMEMELFKESIAGRYYGGTEPQIVLYFQNFPSPWKMSNPEFTASIATTLAHEYLHFLHDYYVSNFIKTVKPFKDKRLSEALADFFGVLYALDQKYISVVEDRYDLWKDREGTDWPYSCALKFFEKPYKLKIKDYSNTEMDDATQKFRDVFRNTINPKDAKKLLGI